MVNEALPQGKTSRGGALASNENERWGAELRI